MNSFQREIRRFRDALRGIFFFLKEGEHAKFHLLCAALVLIAGFYFDIEKTHWFAIIISITIVFIAELVNTAIEMLGDFVHKEQHPAMGKIKDVAAGAVLLAALGAAAVGLIIFIPEIF